MKSLFLKLSLLAIVTLSPKFTLSAQDKSVDTTSYQIKLQFVYNQITLFDVNNIEDSLILKKGEPLINKDKFINYFAKYRNTIYEHINIELRGNSKVQQIGTLLRFQGKDKDQRDALDATRYWKNNVYLETEAETEIYINGKYISNGSSFVNVRPYDKVTVKNKLHNEIKEVKLKEKYKSLFETQTVNFSTLRSNYWKKAWFPGLYQIEKREYGKSALYFSAISFGLYYTISNLSQYRNYHNKFNSSASLYNITTNPITILELRDQTFAYQDKSNSYLKKTYTGFLSTLLFYGFTLWESSRSPKGGFFKALTINPYTDSFDDAKVAGIHIDYRLNGN